MMAEDLIKREDALQALVESDVRGYEYRQMEEAIKAIPSAVIGENRNEYVETRNDGNTVESYLEEYEGQML